MITARDKKILKIAIAICAAISFGLVLFYFIDHNVGDSLFYFNEHFALGIALMFIGCVALMMPIVAKEKFTDNKGDSMMFMVSVLLFLCGIISIVMSYIDLGI